MCVGAGRGRGPRGGGGGGVISIISSWKKLSVKGEGGGGSDINGQSPLKKQNRLAISP